MTGMLALVLVLMGAAALASEASGSSSRSRSRVLREVLPYDPVPHEGAIVKSPCGTARFTVLTSRLIRLEQGQADDRATLAVVHRKLPVVAFNVTHARDDDGREVLVIDTGALQLRYLTNSTFARDSLSIAGPALLQPWHFGDKDPGNLLGTIRSLDNVGPITLDCAKLVNKKVHKEGLHCQPGLISRETGWYAYHDTGKPRLHSATGWWTPPAALAADQHDVLFFGFGLDFKGALRDFVKVSGKAAMVPRRAMGVWWTRWFDYDADDLRGVLRDFEQLRLPLDVLVLDMNWHNKPAWGGYSWDRALFPHPGEAFGALKRDFGVLTVANLHDDDGIQPGEESFAKVAALLNHTAGPNGTDAAIPFASCSDPDFAFALEDVVLDGVRLNGSGMDFWWNDWQQGGARGGCTGGAHNPTIWLSRLRALQGVRTGSGQRDMQLSRWGGLGNHRYQVGFSADVDVPVWSRLAYQPYFTVTAANVAFGLWSHDITGPLIDPAVIVRWTQWGAWSPVMRFHERGMSAGPCDASFPAEHDWCCMGEPSQLPARHLRIVRSALQHRMRMLPLWYSLVRELYDTGVSPLRPMYYDHPRLDAAYDACSPDGKMAQYMVGQDTLVAPVVHPASRGSGLAKKTVWLPPGVWLEPGSGRRRRGPANFVADYDLDEVPVWVRAGAVVATTRLPEAGSLVGRLETAAPYDTLVFGVHLDASARRGATTVYQDDGGSLAYTSRNGSMCTSFTYSFDEVAATLKATVVTTCGACHRHSEGAPLSACDYYRTHAAQHPTLVVALRGTLPGASLSLGGGLGGDAAAAAEPEATSTVEGAPVVEYVAHELETVVELEAWDMSKPVTLTLRDIRLTPQDVPVMGIIASCRTAKRAFDRVRKTPRDGLSLQRCASSHDTLEHLAKTSTHPASAVEAFIKTNVTALLDGAFAEVGRMHAWPRQRYAAAALQRFSSSSSVSDNKDNAVAALPFALPL